VRSPIPDYLAEVLGSVESDETGAPADYIPDLATANPNRLAAAMATLDGEVYAVGDCSDEFTIQSISKPFVYALALADRGFEPVLAKVGVEPSGEAFNKVSLDGGGRPLNPMINAGAIATHSLAGPAGIDAKGRFDRIVDGLSAFAGRRLQVDEAVFASEMDTAFRNTSIAYLLRAYDVLDEDPTAVVGGYTRQCSLLVTTVDLALMAATLANRGIQPVTGERVVPEAVVRQVLSVMTTCGMYDAAGDWVTQVGIPAKSGVAGGLIGALPGQVGIATFSPRLDRHGNSVRGVTLFERFADDMGMHMMDVPSSSTTVIRKDRRIADDLRLYVIQGGLRFAEAEHVVRRVSYGAPKEHRIAIDLSHVHAIDDVARRMILEVIRRLSLDGHEVFLVDPEQVIPNPDPGTGGSVTVVTTVGDID